jgi:regulator of replication initiation timing
MDEKRLERIEDMLSNLITMVGSINSKLQSSLEEQAAMRSDISAIQKEQSAMRSEMETRHSEIMDKLKIIQADQDYIWEKSARNEREIAKIKNRVQL